MNEFDIKAAGWDANPMHWERSKAIADEIANLIPLNTNWNALEYGAGTGISSFLLKDKLKEITLMDNSAEMVRIMNEKIATSEVQNIKVLNFDLEHSEFTGGKFDLIFTQMVLHHVADTESIIAKFHDLLVPGGFLAVADLYPEDGSFHGPDADVHHGFDVDSLSDILKKIHFINIFYKECFIINRQISDTLTKPFPVFIMIGKRRD